MTYRQLINEEKHPNQ